MERQKPLERGSGVLLPVFSLPSPGGIGDLGEEARRFVFFLREAGQAYWQVLPLGPTGFADSPYQSFSAFAGNPLFIDTRPLDCPPAPWEGRADRVDYPEVSARKDALLRQAFRRFRPDGEFSRFRRDNRWWLEDYTLFMALKRERGGAPWFSWEEPLRSRRPEALASARVRLEEECLFQEFCQFVFFSQWGQLRRCAEKEGIRLIGDLPLYVAMDSADVWSEPRLFELDGEGRPASLAGVPPDCFSGTGQCWGNPLYRWDEMEAEGFSWWRRRMGRAAECFDWVRIDHFIGIARYYAVEPQGDARMGAWREGPGQKLVEALRRSAGDCRLLAEDLGLVPPEARRLMEENGLPGMRVLQFALDGGEDNPHLPQNYEENCAAYPGTHDNGTLAAFLLGLSPDARERAAALTGLPLERITREGLTALLMESRAAAVILPAQDLLGLGGEARMNTPATVGGNWRWRLLPGQLTKALARELRAWTQESGRCGPDGKDG